MASSMKSALSLPKVYIITGGTGAGKTTYARKLASEIGAVRFSIDDWMTTLFWMDSPYPISFDWAMSRIARSEAQIWKTASQVLFLSVSVILDLGFTKAAHRTKFKELADSHNVETVMHWIDVSAEERWRRVQLRNTQKGETFAMEVPRDMFEFMENEWEAPSDDETSKMTSYIIT